MSWFWRWAPVMASKMSRVRASVVTNSSIITASIMTVNEGEMSTARAVRMLM